MSTALLESSRPVAPIDLKIDRKAASPATTPVNTPENGATMSEEPAKMKKPMKMKKAPRRASVALAQTSPSMLEEDGPFNPKAFQSQDGGAPSTPRAMKKPMKKAYAAHAYRPLRAAPLCSTCAQMSRPLMLGLLVWSTRNRRASLMPGQTPTADGSASTDFKPTLASIPASGPAAEPAADALGQMPLKAAPKPTGGNLKGKGAKRNSVANLGAPANVFKCAATAAPLRLLRDRATARLHTGADPNMLAAMAEAGMEDGSASEVRSPPALLNACVG
jgi:hypothetical protein